VAVSVSDTGSGIPLEFMERIFEPYFNTKGVGQGTGLGLSQLLGFAKQSGGEIRVKSGQLRPGRACRRFAYDPLVQLCRETSLLLRRWHGTILLHHFQYKIWNK
jgi:signal transduction histidine kinase